MFSGVRYMGTKRLLASQVADMVSSCQDGTFLDLFSGMCSVGSKIGSRRRIWSNDFHHFPFTVAGSQFCSRDLPLDSLTSADLARDLFISHRNSLEAKYRDVLQYEESILVAREVEKASNLFYSAIESAKINSLESNLIVPYELFTRRYAGSYFSFKQSIEVDSIRRAIDWSHLDRTINLDQKNWLIVALGIALSKCANTTGHFAQALRPNIRNISKFINQRQRSIYEEWLKAIEGLSPVGSRSWRSHNKAFQSDALLLLEELQVSSKKPSVIYADPPYTKDQYSRFYHIYETLILYDYPPATGNGLYRDKRTVSSFSHITKVAQSIENLVEGASRLGADLILSYPCNGLLINSEVEIPKIFENYFAKSKIEVFVRSHQHSTLGASTGSANNSVTEVLYKAAA